MQYIGALYGHITGTRKYFETGKTSEDWDRLESSKATQAETIRQQAIRLAAAQMTDNEAVALYKVMEAFKTIRLARGVLCDVAQLISGWKTTTPSNEWSQWDEQTFQKLVELQKRIEPNTKLTHEAGGENL